MVGTRTLGARMSRRGIQLGVLQKSPSFQVVMRSLGGTSNSGSNQVPAFYQQTQPPASRPMSPTNLALAKVLSHSITFITFPPPPRHSQYRITRLRWLLSIRTSACGGLLCARRKGGGCGVTNDHRNARAPDPRALKCIFIRINPYPRRQASVAHVLAPARMGAAKSPKPAGRPRSITQRRNPARPLVS